MKVLLTGTAGFIGAYLARALLDRGAQVTGVDNLNAYYDPALKRARLGFLAARSGFDFHERDLSAEGALAGLGGPFDWVLHMAAQAGVRYSLQSPYAHVDANVRGHLTVLEYVRAASPRPWLLYASSSSVYGDETPAPFSEDARADAPASLYAATKRAGELMSESYARLYAINQIGLRFFTVYGPWGRPDMAYWRFAEAMLEGRPIEVYNKGDLKRDFTWIEDVVEGVMRILERAGSAALAGRSRHRLYNIGNSRPERLGDFIAALEAAVGVKAHKIMRPMQPGDVHVTAADTTAIARDYGFRPTTRIETGLPRFVAWLKAWRAGRAETWSADQVA